MLSGRTVAVAAVLTVLNALKPVQIDDYAYISMARQIARHPFDPLGFTLFWDEMPLPANQHLLTPLVPYALAPALALFPASVWIWKLWLFPFALILCAALGALLRRFSPGIADQVLALAVCSPAVLPTFNLMLDVPALAMNLAAVALFLYASDTRSLRFAVLAGVVGGLGAQAKYTALAAFPAILLCALLRRFWSGGLAASIAGGIAFASWELFLIARYGQSMLASTVGGKESAFLLEPWAAAAGTVGLIGGLAPGLLALSLSALRFGNVALGGLVALNLLVPVAMAFAPLAWFEALSARGMTRPRFPPELVLFLPLGLLTVLASIAVAWRRAWVRDPAQGAGERWHGLFIAGWVLIELVAFIGMTPFLAARRLIGLITALTLLTAWAAHGSGARLSSVRLAAALSVTCGVWVWAIDVAAARDTQRTVENVARRLPAVSGARPRAVWYAGHWSFQYYAEAQGWHAVVPGRSVLMPGDLLVLPTRMSRQPVTTPPGTLKHEWDLDDAPTLPLTTIPFFYVTSVPYGRLFGPQVTGTVQRVLRETSGGSAVQP